MKITLKPFAKIRMPFIVMLMGMAVYAQDPIQVVNNYTNDQLVNALVDNDCAAVSNISINGFNNAPNKSYGYFTSGPDFPFATGILLSTGFATSAPGPNNNILSDGANTWGGDADLEQALGISNTLNATTMEFDFVPTAGHISFDYIFASEEYTSWSDLQACSYSDAFAFLLKEAGSTGPYQNLAVIPGTNTPVQVTTVRGQGFCPPANTEYFESFNGVNHAINFNGQTVVLTAEADVTPGTLYHIKLVIADQGDTQYDAAVFLKGNSFSTTVDLGDSRLIADGSAVCDGEVLPVTAVTPNATAYQWFKNGHPIPGAIAANYTITTEGDYSVQATLSPTCFARGAITVEYNPPIDLPPFRWNQCDDNNDGLTAYYLFRIGSELVNNHEGISMETWHLTEAEAENSINNLMANTTLPFYNTVPGQVIFARVKNEAGCVAIIPVTLSTPPLIAFSPAPVEVCDTDNDGIYTFNFTQLSEDILDAMPAGTWVNYFASYDNALGYIYPITPSQYNNTVAGGQTIYVEVTNIDGCYAIMDLHLIVHTFGDTATDETAYVCEGSDITLDAGGFTSYRWNTNPVQTTRNITVEEPGDYIVTITNDEGCEAARTFTVLQSGHAESAAIELDDFRGNDNTITITAAGSGTYEYSINGTDWQESPVFTHLPGGEYTIFIRDANGCGPVYTDTVFLLDAPVFFTPNGDGINDTWRIPFSYNRPGLFTTVFDRYGRIITGFKGYEQGWDGTYNGAPLPATDYWYVVELENGRKARGHFSMVR